MYIGTEARTNKARNEETGSGDGAGTGLAGQAGPEDQAGGGELPEGERDILHRGTKRGLPRGGRQKVKTEQFIIDTFWG